jgi:cyclohexadienyl dehydratase
LCALAAGCLVRHQEEGPLLRVGTSGDYPPFSRAVQDSVEGFDIEVARRFAHDTGRRVEFVPFRWHALAADLAADRFDIAMSGVTMRPERVLAGTYTRPVVESGAVLLARPGVASKPSDVDRTAVRIGVNAGGYLERLARRMFPRALVQPVDDNLSLTRLLDTGGADAVLLDDIEADAVAGTVPEAHRLGPLTHDHKAYLGRDPALVAELDAWLGTHEADGSLAALRAQWLGERRALLRTRAESDRDALVAFLDLRLALMPMVAAAKERAQLPVEDPSRERQVLDAAVAAAQAHDLEADAVAALFRAQIAAGRVIQQAYLMAPPGRRPLADPADLEHELRPALSRVSGEILARAADVVAAPEHAQLLDASGIADALDPVLTPLAARADIGRAVAALRPAR